MPKPQFFNLVLLCLLLLGTVETASAQVSNTCFFVQGPRTGQTQFFAGFPPIPLGTACNDGISSRGFAVPNGQTQPTGTFGMSNGMPMCTDIIQMPVPFRTNELVPKSGLATLDEFARPVVFLKQSQVSTFSEPVRNFLYAHECGHHALGQVRAGAMFGVFIGPPLELAADCFAMRELKRLDLVNAASIGVILKFLSQVPGDPTTFNGPERVRRLQQCM